LVAVLVKVCVFVLVAVFEEVLVGVLVGVFAWAWIKPMAANKDKNRIIFFI